MDYWWPLFFVITGIAGGVLMIACPQLVWRYTHGWREAERKGWIDMARKSPEILKNLEPPRQYLVFTRIRGMAALLLGGLCIWLLVRPFI